MPLVTVVDEVRLVRAWIREAQRSVPGAPTVPIRVGAMVEAPAAALLADRLARECDFLSFGTNDLTQLLFGLSREDYLPIVQTYRQRGLLDADPFERPHPLLLDVVERAARLARQANPSLTVGLCGLHATDPSMIRLCASGLLDYL